MLIMDFLKEYLNLDDSLINLAKEAEDEVREEFLKIEGTAQKNQAKVLAAFRRHRVSEAHFAYTTGYGYGDLGRDTLDEIYAEVFGAEDALVRHNIISGTHALTLALFGVLRPGDTLLAPAGKPYDTLDSVIGITPCDGSLADFGVNYEQIDLQNGEINFEKINEALEEKKIKACLIQRSKGYDWRESLNIQRLAELIAFIKRISPETICIVDNCYGEFVEDMEPTEVGADLIVGSLIKNPGGGLAHTGGYIAGKRDLIEKIAYRHTSPGIGKEAGCSLGQNRLMYQGFFMAPHTVSQSVKAAVFASALLKKLGFTVLPGPKELRTDIIQAVKFNDKETLIKFCQGIQHASPVDSYVTPMPWGMPGYNDEVIMAAGTFIAGASIELSADAPIREPYICYLQGGLTYESAKIQILNAVKESLMK